MRACLILLLLLAGAVTCHTGKYRESTDLLLGKDEQPELEVNTTTTTEKLVVSCACDPVVFTADEDQGYIKIHPRPEGCAPVECQYLVAAARDSVLTMDVLNSYGVVTTVYYVSDKHDDKIAYKRREWNGVSYRAPENYGFFITIMNERYQERDVYNFRRYSPANLTRFCPEPFLKANNTVQSLQTVNWPRSGCAIRFETDLHPIRLLTTCQNRILHIKANMANSSEVYKEVAIYQWQNSGAEMILPGNSDVSFMTDYYYHFSDDTTLNCDIKYLAIDYDPCNCSTTFFNLTVNQPMNLTSPGYPAMMCGNITCQYKFEVSQPAPKGMLLAFVVDAVHKTKVRGDYLLFKVDNMTVDNLNEHQKNISETALYLGDHLEVEYSASSLFSNDHGFELELMAIHMPEDCKCPTHKAKELSSAGTFDFSIPPHCPTMYCRFKIPNSEMGKDRIFRLDVDYHLPHEREGVIIDAGEMEHGLYGEEEEVTTIDLHNSMDFVTNSTVSITYYREMQTENVTGISNFSLKWNWVTKSECACHSTGTLFAPTGQYDVIYSPRWPQEYCSNSHCEYHIQATEGYHIRLNVSFFETEPHSDFVYVYDGLNSTQISRLSGHLKKNPIIETKSRNATVLFTSDASNNVKGFKIQYQAVRDPIVPIGQESSGSTFVVITVVIVLVLLAVALFMFYKKFVKKNLVLQTVENPVFSFSADQDIVVVFDKE